MPLGGLKRKGATQSWFGEGEPETLVKQARAQIDRGLVREGWEILNKGICRYPRSPLIIAAMRECPPTYDETFYDTEKEASLRSARTVLGILAEHFPFRSVVDFGAGVGTWLQAAAERGATQIVGIEGDWVRKSDRRYPQADYVFVDLNDRVELDRRFDLAISVEVAEHLDPDRSAGFVKDIVESSDVVVFGAALPRQFGTGHMNGRPHSFWINNFGLYGYKCIDLFRPAVWYDQNVCPWYAQNTFLFARSTIADTFKAFPPAGLVDVYHPLLINDLVKEDAENGISDPRSDLLLADRSAGM